jgi:alpha-galactosidase
MLRFYFLIILAACTAAGGGICAMGQTPANTPPPAPSYSPAVSLDMWKAKDLPFSFKYDGKDSSQFLSTWQEKEETAPSNGGLLHRYIFTDPATKLTVTAEVRTFDKYPAIDWVLRFTNGGSADTPLIEDVTPLHWSLPVQNGPSLLHWAHGSNASPDDFKPEDSGLDGDSQAEIRSSGGRSSNNCLPFFNLQTGDRGLIGAIGWTGNWFAHFAGSSANKAITLTAGMQKTHFLLHPSETIRTPRIVLLDWHGERTDAQNVWRQFVLNYYSPRDLKGHTLTIPLVFGWGGVDTSENLMKTITALHDKQVPIDDYWVDAGWYANLQPGQNEAWDRTRGTWITNPRWFPDGLKPFGEALNKFGFGFILWSEPETADAGSKLRTDHPEWFFPTANPNDVGLLNLGDPVARKGITDLISSIIEDAGLAWYRQDFNQEPESQWARGDTPDRVGISEMKDIEGLYAYWDALRARHPGLQIDNCSSGGRRLDLETCSRSVPLFRSDMACNFTDPIGSQLQTQALNVWLPLNVGVYCGCAPGTPSNGASIIYALRSSYSSGFAYGTDRLDINLMKPAGDEFIEVRPYFTGDFYPLTSYRPDADAWAAWQFHRADLGSGIVLALRRQGSPFVSIQPGLHAIDPAAQYDVEIRTGFEKGVANPMSGKDLSNLVISIPDKPGSVIVFYQKR